MRIIKKSLCFLIITCLMLTVFGTAAFAEEASTFAIPERTKTQRFEYTVYQNGNFLVYIAFDVTVLYSSSHNYSQILGVDFLTTDPNIGIFSPGSSSSQSNTVTVDVYYNSSAFTYITFTVSSGGYISEFVTPYSDTSLQIIRG